MLGNELRERSQDVLVFPTLGVVGNVLQVFVSSARHIRVGRSGLVALIVDEVAGANHFRGSRLVLRLPLLVSRSRS